MNQQYYNPNQQTMYTQNKSKMPLIIGLIIVILGLMCCCGVGGLAQIGQATPKIVPDVTGIEEYSASSQLREALGDKIAINK